MAVIKQFHKWLGFLWENDGGKSMIKISHMNLLIVVA